MDKRKLKTFIGDGSLLQVFDHDGERITQQGGGNLSLDQRNAIIREMVDRHNAYPDLLARVAALEDMLQRIVANIDVSTIRPGKRNEAQWGNLSYEATQLLTPAS
jgi:hypothetical protein